MTTGHLPFEQALDLALLATVGSPGSHPTLAAQSGAGRVQDEVAAASVVSGRLGRRGVGQQGKLLQDFDADDVVAEYRVTERVLKRGVFFNICCMKMSGQWENLQENEMSSAEVPLRSTPR